MKPIFYQIKFIILGLTILPMFECLANLFFYMGVISLTGSWSEIFSYLEIAIRIVTPYFFENLFLLYKQSIVPMTIFIIAYSFYYKTHKSFKLMAFIWAVGGALISYYFMWKFLQDPFWGIDEKLTPYALGIFALAGALAAVLVILLMGKKSVTSSLHDTFK